MRIKDGKFQDGGFFTVEQISPHREKTPEGYLLCRDVTIARSGTFDYTDAEVSLPAKNGVIHMTRSEEELFSESTMKSYEGKPVTIGHDHFLDPKNWSEYAVGIVQNVRRGEGNASDQLIADLLITSQEGIDVIESGELTEVSCGFDAEGVSDGEGVGHQVGIVGNHVALVQKARCGSACQIKDGFMAKTKKQAFVDHLKALFKARDEDGFNKALEEVEEVQETEEKPQAADLSEIVAKIREVVANVSPELSPESLDSIALGVAQNIQWEKKDAKESEMKPTTDEDGEQPKEEGKEPEKEGDEDKPPVDTEKSVEERLAVLEHEYQELAPMLRKLIEAEKKEGHEELKDEDDEPKENEGEDDEVEEKESKEVLSDAETVCPGMKKPTGDSKSGKFTRGMLERVKRMALKGCPDAAQFGDASALDGQALDIAFKACVALTRGKNNPHIQAKDSASSEGLDINQINRKFWENK